MVSREIRGYGSVDNGEDVLLLVCDGDVEVVAVVEIGGGGASSQVSSNTTMNPSPV
ncbi:MAG: hypothetical protein ACFFE3_03645 [Candidatus Thorarchaeota archaeon]